VAQLVEALHHMAGGSGFDFRMGHWNVSSDLTLPSAFVSPGVHSTSNRNWYQEFPCG
jgi:hypothetical protein